VRVKKLEGEEETASVPAFRSTYRKRSIPC